MRDWLAIRAAATPTRTALVAAGDVMTPSSYAALDERVEELAGRLAASGVGVDDPLAVCAGTRAEFVEVAHAAQRLGAVLVPLDARLPAASLADRLAKVEPAAVLCEARTEPTVVEALDGDRTVVQTGVQTLDDPVESAGQLEDVRPEPFDLPEWEIDDPMLVLFTSGSTGEPKPVVLTLGNVLASATASAFRLGLRPDDCWHVPLPMYHMGGLAPVYRSVLYGTRLSVERRPEDGFDPRATLAALDEADATAVSLVPTMLERLLDADEYAGAGDVEANEADDDEPTARSNDQRAGSGAGVLSGLRFVLLGGAPCSPSLLERAQEVSVPVAPTYGMTETASQVATARPEEAHEHPSSVGHPLMFADVTVRTEAGARCAPGETGELVVAGPMVTPGYLGEGTTGESFCNDGLRTGDRGYRDDDGRVYVEGRVDDTVRTGGENVAPAEVAAALRTHPAVDDCAVVGVPDPEWGERVAALVVPVPDRNGRPAPVTGDDLRAHCADRLADFKRPRTVAFADELPRTASGTIDRGAVQRILEEKSACEG